MMTPYPPSRPPIPQRSPIRWVITTILAVAILGAGVAAVMLTVAKDRPQHQLPDYAAIAGATRDGVVAILGYTPETVRNDVAKTKNLLTGEFLDYYTKFTDDTVIPHAEKTRMSAKAEVTAAGVTSADNSAATVLVFV
ncbi:hypothetical protein ACAG26_22115 [Mycobacterium sp. pUA109]|uniref:hypothetical protein n=1 Tax=Mycobacterium sp. pUA109 TaxID=3238982 RepID=UPI00351AF35D